MTFQMETHEPVMFHSNPLLQKSCILITHYPYRGYSERYENLELLLQQLHISKSVSNIAGSCLQFQTTEG